MTSKSLVFALASLFTAISALAQIPASSDSKPAASSGGHGPLQFVRVVPGAVTSESWAGYVVTGQDFTYVKGSWKMHELDCPVTPDAYAEIWVGIDGYLDSTVEQIGVTATCNGVNPSYSAWYELFPAAAVPIDMTINPDDLMGASVSYSGGNFTLGLHNHNTGAEFHVTATDSAAMRTSAEWVLSGEPCTGLPLADFSVIDFGKDYTSDVGTSYATDSTVNDAPIADFGTSAFSLTLECTGGVKWAIPTSLTTDGTSFKVNWR